MAAPENRPPARRVGPGMGRGRAVLLVAAAVVGILGGVAGGAGLTRPDGRAAAPSSEQPTGEQSTGEQPTGDRTAPPNEPLLLHAGQRLHDGEQVVDVVPSGPGAGRLRQGAVASRLVRREGGYLLSFPPPDAGLGEETGEALWTVDADGTATRVAEVAPGWDVKLDGTRVVGHDLAEGLLTTWDAVTGEPVARWDGSFGARDSAAYAGDEDQVLISSRVDPRTYRLRRWDVAAATTTTEELPGYDRMGVSPGGSYVAGTVGPDGAASDDTASCLQLHQTFLRSAGAFWTTCDWRPEGSGRPEFSPGGTLLLAVPSADEGDNPSEYAVIDASDGPDPVVARIPAPNGTVEATWADDESIYLTGIATTDYAAEFWVRRCTFDGECTELSAGAPGEVVVAGIR